MGTVAAGRRLVPAVLVGTVLAAALAGCAKSSEPGAVIGGAPTGTTSAPPTSAPASPTPPPATTPAGPVYPKDAKSYSQQLLSAWGKADYDRLSQLAIQSAVQQIKDSITFGGIPNTTWTHISCGPGDNSNSTTCIFRNAHGDEATIKLTNTQLGFPTAVTEAMLNRTEYPDDPGAYAGNFMVAWQEGNRQRMARLSSTAIRNYFVSENPPMLAYGQDTPVDVGGGFSIIVFSGLSSDSGRYYTLKVRNSPGGKANSIVDYCEGFGCTP